MVALPTSRGHPAQLLSGVMSSISEMTLRQVWNTILRPIEVTARGTIEIYDNAVEWWSRFAGDVPISQTNQQTVAIVRAGCLSAGLATATWNKIWRHIRAIFRRLGPVSIRPDSLAVLTSIPYSKPLREDRKNPRCPSRTELREMLQACEKATYPISHPSPPAMWRAMLVCCWATGLRRTDLLSLTWDDFDLASGVVTARNRKSHKLQAIPLHSDAMATLSDLLKVCSQREPRVFPVTKCNRDLYGQFQKIQEFAGLRGPYYAFHDLRRAAATDTYQYTGDLTASQMLLGHSSPQTTRDCYLVVDKALWGAMNRRPSLLDHGGSDAACARSQPG